MQKPIKYWAVLPISLFYLFNTNLQSPAVLGDHVLAQHEISLNKRYPNSLVNDVFKDNILLNLAYLSGKVSSQNEISWPNIKKPTSFEFVLKPNQTFAFHEDIDQKYKDTLVRTTNAHFNYQEGFKSDGYLAGDGVCHLASLMYWAAKDANLATEAPTNHDFADIPQIPKQFGISIFYNPQDRFSNIKQNLYITNNKNKALTFKFDYIYDQLKLSIIETR